MLRMTREKSFYKAFFSLTGLMALQNAITCGVNLADNVMLGAYSEAALSGAALANQMQFLLQMVVMGVGEGIVVLASQYWGKKDTAAIRRLTAIGCRIGLFIGLGFWAAGFFLTMPCLRLFTGEETVLAEGARYLKIVCCSYLFFALTNILLASLKSVETVRIGFLVSLSTLLINICLNSLLIYDHPGRPGLGAQGAAIATLTSRAVEFLIVCGYLKFADRKIRMHPAAFLHIDRPLARDYIRTGFPVILSNGLWGVAMGVQMAILGHLGATAIAANSLAATVFQILTVVLYGSAGAAAVITGKTVGEGRLGVLREYSRTFQLLFLAIGVLTGLGLFCIRDFIISLYAITPEARHMAAQFITVLAVTTVGTAYQCPVLTGIVRGGGDTRFVLYNDLVFMWGVVLPLSAAAAFRWGFSPAAVFVCLKCDQILKCFVAAVKVNRGSWVRTLTKDGSAAQP